MIFHSSRPESASWRYTFSIFNATHELSKNKKKNKTKKKNINHGESNVWLLKKKKWIVQNKIGTLLVPKVCLWSSRKKNLYSPLSIYKIDNLSISQKKILFPMNLFISTILKSVLFPQLSHPFFIFTTAPHHLTPTPTTTHRYFFVTLIHF